MAADLIDRLAAHRTMDGLPRAELAWLASKGAVRAFEAGETLAREHEPIDHLNIVLTGHMSIRFNPGGGVRRIAEWRGGDVTGFLPFSRMKGSPGRVVAEEPIEVLQVHRDCFPEMIRERPELTERLVHIMLDRARMFRATELHDEKMRSLGRLAAGLAHELNNPASAVDRTAKSLAGCIADFDAAARALGAANLSAEQLAAIHRLHDAGDLASARHNFSSVEALQREDALADWMEDHGVVSVDLDSLVETYISPAALDELTQVLDAGVLATALRYLGSLSRAHRLAEQIETAASRIHSLVLAVKGFTYMDQSGSAQPVDIGRGLRDTITVLRAKARQKSVELRLDVAPGIPSIDGFGGELNQVWANLIENAIDAVAESGQVSVSATHDRDFITVRVLDDGPGIPSEIIDRIFDPFFTTKDVGEGTGLGLDIAQRLTARHDGSIKVESRPGHTEFIVTLPTAPPATEGKRSEAH